jgi:hypothetical protein
MWRIDIFYTAASHASRVVSGWRLVLVLVIFNIVVTVIISIMGSVRVMNNDNHFEAEMASSGTKLVVVDFTATWWVMLLII